VVLDAKRSGEVHQGGLLRGSLGLWLFGYILVFTHGWGTVLFASGNFL